MFEWLNQSILPKFLPFIQRCGKDKILKWILIFCGVAALYSVSKGGVASFIFFLLAITYLSSRTLKGRRLNLLLKKKRLTGETENSEYWLAIICVLLGLMLSPAQPSISTAKALSASDKQKIKDNGSDAKVHCLTYVKLSLDGLDYDISFPYAHRQLDDQIYIVNMKGKVENVFGGKTRKEWDCQIKYSGNGNASKFDNWELQAIEDRDI